MLLHDSKQRLHHAFGHEGIQHNPPLVPSQSTNHLRKRWQREGRNRPEGFTVIPCQRAVLARRWLGKP